MPRNRSCGSYGPDHLMHWIPESPFIAAHALRWKAMGRAVLHSCSPKSQNQAEAK